MQTIGPHGSPRLISSFEFNIVSTSIFQKATQLLPLHFVPFIWSGTVSRSQALRSLCPPGFSNDAARHHYLSSSKWDPIAKYTFALLYSAGCTRSCTWRIFTGPQCGSSLHQFSTDVDPSKLNVYGSLAMAFLCVVPLLKILFFIGRFLRNYFTKISTLLGGNKNYFFLSQQIRTRVGHLWLRQRRQSLKTVFGFTTGVSLQLHN